MSDVRADDGALPEEDRLPWLEAVEEDEPEGPSAGKMIAFVVIGLVAIGLIVGGLFWMNNRDAAADGDGTLIAAPEGDYKVPPSDPGGMKVDGEGDTAFAASEGADPRGNIDVNALPEAPVAKAAPAPEAPKAPAPTPAPKAEAPQPKQATPAPAAPAAAGGAIQLGAFSSQAAANSAWKAMAARFKYLAPLSHSVTPVTSNGKTLYRLRASGPDADGICGRLRVAGEQCVQVN